MNSKVLVRNIRSICQRKGISIMHMEEDLGFSPGLISRWSKTKTSPSFDKIVDIVRYLEVSFEDLLREGPELNEEDEKQNDRYYFKDYVNENKTEYNTSEKDTLYERLAELTVQRKIHWEKGRESELYYDLPIENVIDIRKYSTHEWYCYKTKTGCFILVAQYNQYTHKLNTALYVVADSLMDLVKEETENSRWYEMILKCVDKKFYGQISKDKANDVIVDFLNADFNNASGMG